MITWQQFRFEELSNTHLYQLIKLRIDVFVVEQTCPYPELDNKDTLPGTCHLLGFSDNGTLVAYSRLLAPGTSYENASIGRVVTLASARGNRLGHDLIEEAIAHCNALWPGQDIDIGAQHHLIDFYAQHGFQAISEPYLEDDIPHINMRCSLLTASEPTIGHAEKHD